MNRAASDPWGALPDSLLGALSWSISLWGQREPRPGSSSHGWYGWSTLVFWTPSSCLLFFLVVLLAYLFLILFVTQNSGCCAWALSVWQCNDIALVEFRLGDVLIVLSNKKVALKAVRTQWSIGLELTLVRWYLLFPTFDSLLLPRRVTSYARQFSFRLTATLAK